MHFRLNAHTADYHFICDEFDAPDLATAVIEMRKRMRDYVVYDCSISVDIAWLEESDGDVCFDELDSSIAHLLREDSQ